MDYLLFLPVLLTALIVVFLPGLLVGYTLGAKNIKLFAFAPVISALVYVAVSFLCQAFLLRMNLATIVFFLIFIELIAYFIGLFVNKDLREFAYADDEKVRIRKQALRELRFSKRAVKKTKKELLKKSKNGSGTGKSSIGPSSKISLFGRVGLLGKAGASSKSGKSGKGKTFKKAAELERQLAVLDKKYKSIKADIPKKGHFELAKFLRSQFRNISFRDMRYACVAIPAVVFIIIVCMFVMGSPNNFSATSGNVFNMNLIRYICDTGMASPMYASNMVDTGATAFIYLDVFQLFASTVALCTFMNIPMAINAVTIVLYAFAFVLGCILLVQFFAGFSGNRKFFSCLLGSLAASIFFVASVFLFSGDAQYSYICLYVFVPVFAYAVLWSVRKIFLSIKYLSRSHKLFFRRGNAKKGKRVVSTAKNFDDSLNAGYSERGAGDSSATDARSSSDNDGTDLSGDKTNGLLIEKGAASRILEKISVCIASLKKYKKQILVCIFAVVFVFEGGYVFCNNIPEARANYAPNENSLIRTDDLAVFNAVKDTVPSNSLVLTSSENGGSFLYAFTGVYAYPMAIDESGGKYLGYLVANLNKSSSSEKVCSILSKFDGNIYVLDLGEKNNELQSDYDFDGLSYDGFEKNDKIKYEVVYTSGNAHLLKINQCD